MWQVIHGDCIDALKGMPDNSADSVVTDPPYALSFMGKDWDSFGNGVGYQAWCELWAAECLRVLKPGGYLLAFGGTRTYHRLACAIEDAGFEIRDSLHWIYGSGFPKSRDIGKAIDSEAGVEFSSRPASGVGFMNQNDDGYHNTKNQLTRIGESTAAAKQWDGWGTALKPAHEPIVMARKPLAAKHTVAGNVLEYGTGAINVDGCRIGSELRVNSSAGNKPGGAAYQMSVTGMPQDAEARECEGRWPANLVFSHSPDCVLTDETRTIKTAHREEGRYVGSPDKDIYGKGLNQVMSRAYGDPGGSETLPVWDCADDCPVAELDRQSGELNSRWGDGRAGKDGSNAVFGAQSHARDSSQFTYGDKGGASRFFYCAKAGKKERPQLDGLPGHPTVKPLKLMRYLVRLVTQPGGIVLDPFAGTGTTAEACELEGLDSVIIENDAVSIRRIGKRMSKYQEEAA